MANVVRQTVNSVIFGVSLGITVGLLGAVTFYTAKYIIKLVSL